LGLGSYGLVMVSARNNMYPRPLLPPCNDFESAALYILYVNVIAFRSGIIIRREVQGCNGRRMFGDFVVSIAQLLSTASTTSFRAHRPAGPLFWWPPHKTYKKTKKKQTKDSILISQDYNIIRVV